MPKTTNISISLSGGSPIVYYVTRGDRSDYINLTTIAVTPVEGPGITLIYPFNTSGALVSVSGWMCRVPVGPVCVCFVAWLVEAQRRHLPNTALPGL